MRRIAIAVALVACATPYQRMGVRGGYKESAIGPNAWLITVEGNGYTKRSRLVEYSYRRAGELCPNGFDVLDADRSTRTSQVSFDGGKTTRDVEKSDVSLAVRCQPPR